MSRTAKEYRNERRVFAMVGALGASVLMTTRPAMGDTPANVGQAYAGIVLAIGATVPLGADVYYTVKDIGHSWSGTQPSRGAASNEFYWTFWQAGILAPISVSQLAMSEPYWGDADDARALYVISMWPTALAAHGLWYKTPENRWAPTTILAVGEGLMLGYDGVRLAMDQPFKRSYLDLEILFGSGQLIYGAGTVLHTERGERWRALALLAVPLTLVTHGVLAPTEVRSTGHQNSNSLMLSARPIPAGMTLSVASRW